MRVLDSIPGRCHVEWAIRFHIDLGGGLAAESRAPWRQRELAGSTDRGTTEEHALPGHFTHIYTQRRVADWLAQQATFNPDDTGGDAPAEPLAGGFLGLDPKRASEVMTAWPTFAAVGAIGPDLFFFCQDYSSGPLAEFPFEDDLLMLAMRVAYWVDSARDQDWEPLLVLLAEANTTFAQVVRFLLQLQKIWDDFIQAWDATIGPVVDAIDAALDDLTGGVISEAGVAISELIAGLEQVAIQELATFADIFSWFSLKMRVGWDEQAFVWSDMLHYRKTNQMARALLEEAQRQFDQNGDETQFAQFQAFALGWICHLGTDVIDHSFVNEQCGGPFRTHWQRHHLIENHIDAWNYRQGGTVEGQRGTLPDDDLAATDTYTDVGVSALGFSISLDPDHSIQHNTDNAQQYGWTQTPDGWARPADLPDDAATAKDAIDVDGELPDWLAEGIVRALIATYHDGGPEPGNLGGSAFQATAAAALSGLEDLLNAAGISINEPLDQLVNQLAPTPDFEVPPGYPLPWEVQVSHRFMVTYYKFAFWSSFNLDKPRRPSVLIWPPASDLTNLASPPDLSGVSSGDPAEDFCDAVLAIIKWLAQEGEAVGQLVGDIVKALASPGTYPIRWALYQLAMWGWDTACTAHEILAHTGFMLPHGPRTYSDNGEQRWTNEIDHGLISLGSSLDGSFLQALMDAIDPFGNLDNDPSLLVPPHNPRDRNYPYLPIRDVQLPSGSVIEFHRPWDYPTQSGPQTGLYQNAGEVSDIRAEVDYVGRSKDLASIMRAGVPAQAGTTSGPFPQGATPDQVFFRTGRPVSPAERAQYEQAPSPAHTDAANLELIGTDASTDHSPLGDPVQFIGYLMGQVLSPRYDYQADFNLDADRGYGYRCWDWIRGDETGTDQRGQTYPLPVVAPEGAEGGTFTPAPPEQWHGASPAATQQPIQLRYLPDEHGAVDQ
jgi:hypothetical protein